MLRSMKRFKKVFSLLTALLFITSTTQAFAAETTNANSTSSSVTTDGSNIPNAPAVGLTNTGFENGQSPWGVWSDEGAQHPNVVDTNAKNGSHSMQLDNGASIGSHGWGSSTWQTVILGSNKSIAVGDTVQVGAWIKTSSNVDLGKVGVTIERIDGSGGKSPIASIGLPSDLSDGQWHYVTTDAVVVPTGTTQLNITFSDQSLGTINIDDISLFDLTPKDSTISTASASFDKNPLKQADVIVHMNLNGNTLSGVSDGAKTLIQGTDYSVSGSNLTISKSYFSAQEVGTKTLVLSFSAGAQQTITITIVDTSKSSVTSDGSNIPSAPAVGLTNTGFENGQSPWGVWSDDGAQHPNVVDTNAKYGTHSMQLDNGTSIGSHGWGSSTWQTVVLGSNNSIAVGDTVQVGAWIKTSSNVDLGKVGIAIEKIDGSNNKSPLVSMGLPSEVSDGAWHYVTTDAAVISAGTAQLNITFSDQSLGIFNVDDVSLFDLTPKAVNSTINPTAAGFDKNTTNQADITVNMNLNGNTLVNIKDGDNTLNQGVDYTVSGSTVTINKSYLALQAIGPKALTFNFSSGNAQTLNISIVNTSSVNLNPHPYTMVSPGFEDYTTPDNDYSWGIWPGPLHGIDASDPWTGSGIGIVTDNVKEGTKALGMGQGASLWQRIYGGAAGCSDGDVVQVSAWVYAYPGSTGSFIQVDAVDQMANGVHTMVAKSRAIDANDEGKWVQLITQPTGSGKIPAGSLGGIVISIQNSSSKLILDGFKAESLGNNGLGGTDVNTGNKGSDDPYEHLSVYPLANTNFEASKENLSDWGTWGSVSVDFSKAYYGNNSAKFFIGDGTYGNTAIWQTATIGSGKDDAKAGQKVEAGTWIYLNSDADLRSGNIDIEVNALDAGNNKTLIAKSEPLAVNSPKGQWIYIKTAAVGEGILPEGSTGYVVSIENTVKGTVNADFVQAGQAGAVNGNPERFSMLAYQPWYGNPTDTVDAADGWYNWLWDQAGPVHDPANILGNGQRDIATAYYPLVGPYDSLNDDLLKYQFDIAKASLFNGFMINDYGREIKPRYRQTIDKMFSLAEQYDMKVAFQYEAKVNIVGWAPSTATGTREQKIDGIVADLKYILDNYSSKKAFLKYNGIPVISIFGANMLTDDEWNHIVEAISGMGYKVNLMGDGIGSGSDMSTVNDAFGSMYNWHLVSGSITSYDTAYSFAENNDKGVRRWVSADPQNRFGVGIIWPGFDDSGVIGWGGGTRKTAYLDDDTKGDTLQATSQAVLDSGVNFALVATMNDWNESTSVEPSKEKGTKYMKELAVFNQKFKGLASVDTSAIDTITTNYLSNDNAVKFIPLQSITASVDKTVLKPGETATIALSGSFGIVGAVSSDIKKLHDVVIEYSSDNQSAVSIDSNGVITAVTPGATANITANVELNGSTVSSNTVTLNVVKLSSITISVDNTLIQKTKTANVSVTGKLSDGTSANLSNSVIQYSTSNPTIASVDSNGVITGNKVGIANITATVTLWGKEVQSNSVTIIIADSDVNNDGKTQMSDLVHVTKALGAKIGDKRYSLSMDMNENDIIDQTDVDFVQQQLLLEEKK